jgi:hypothetical protein
VGVVTFVMLRKSFNVPGPVSGLVAGGTLFDVHVLEFTGLEDLAALFAFYEFSFVVAANDLHARVLARLLWLYALRRSGRL